MAPSKSWDKIEELLTEKFRLESLRPGQEDVIRSVLKKKNTLAIMPTGAGKSLCFQLPALVMRGTTVVITPLIALMKDQTEKLEELDIPALELNSSLSEGEQEENIEAAKRGKVEFIYTTPERFTDPEFISVLKRQTIDLIVIDEAHCVSQWGHDFRPSYLGLRDVIAQIGQPPVLALTATATPQVAVDIQTQLGLKELSVFQSGIMRENLDYGAFVVESEEDKLPKLIELLREAKGSGIIYASTIKAVETLHEALGEAGFDVLKYHGRMGARERERSQDEFMSGDSKVMIATNAFGLGIDKPDIRFVFHHSFPGSLESYYQESGRAGRDGEAASCVLLYLRKDKSTQSFFLAGRYPTSEQIHFVWAAIRALAKDESLTAKRVEDCVESVPKSKVKVILAALRDAGVLKTGSRGRLKLVKAELDGAQVDEIAERYRLKKENDQEKLKRMIVYAQSALCRWKNLLTYFGESVDWERCDHCDNCRTRPRLEDISRSYPAMETASP